MLPKLHRCCEPEERVSMLNAACDGMHSAYWRSVSVAIATQKNADVPDLRYGEDVTSLANSLPYLCLCQTRIMLNNDSTWSIQSSA